jgi:hypothetical protein
LDVLCLFILALFYYAIHRSLRGKNYTTAAISKVR